MQRLSLHLRAMPALAGASAALLRTANRPAPLLAVQQLLRGAQAQATPSPPPHHTYGTTSSPRSAEGPSAESGGSRSKDAAEEHAEETTQDTSGAPAATPDRLATEHVRGRTGGGPPLESSENAPPRPKIHNASVPGGAAEKMTEEQKREVDEHNADFERKHGHAASAAEDKVDKKFWSGMGSKQSGR